jgi:ketosteroid isomerase-like protein
MSSVQDANAAFYRAFSELDLEAMTELWARTERDVCIHPGWPMLRGWEAIEQSWRQIFAGTDAMQFFVSDVAVRSSPELAIVTCIENLISIARGQRVGSRIAATNAFVRTPDGWRLVLHHGSPIAGSTEVADLDDGGEVH